MKHAGATDRDKQLREEGERTIRTLCERGEFTRAVELALALYGQDIKRFALSLTHNADRASEVFSAFQENLVKGLPGFRWESTLRTWSYTVARHACLKLLQAPASQEELFGDTLPSDEPEKERSRTNPWLRTEVKNKLWKLCALLPEDEQTLLHLRLKQQLPWEDIAQVLATPDMRPREEALERRAAALRQKYVRLVKHLREIAQEHGLAPDDYRS